MKPTIREQNIVVILFVMVLIVFSFAQNDSQKIDQVYQDYQAYKQAARPYLVQGNDLQANHSPFVFSRQ